jgi:predicted transcriptional regulator
MATTAVTPPGDCREARRLRALKLKQQRWQQQTIAAALGVTPGAVSQWLKRAAEGGFAAFRIRIRPGARPS